MLSTGLRCLLLVALMSAIPCARGDIAAELLACHNRERKARRLEPLQLDDRLCQAALQQAEYCARRGWPTHYGPHGETWMDRAHEAGYSFSSIAENAAGDFETAETVTRAWMKSAGHKRNLLGNYRDVGLACAEYRGRKAWIALFANPKSVVRR